MKWNQFFQDESGALSSNRLVYLSWSFAILFLLVYLTITGKAFPKIETSLVLLYGSVVAGKVVQSFSENWPSKPTNS
jgi:hypothetical protein